ncbi:MAG: type IV pilin-like G/H family protein [Aulosira sp. ZfuVER01]|nr:type IV pilin-like G/H family protein [Aulosira sp. ZfuVER01]MDZ7996730.1 type IV pilin-like G/H family protein [Aulosira sp. DedVER01a]MDZ8053780.1 type IV pilin-like G/H family protein [Aulosira sp. ZfuCHP01]
MFIRIFFLTKIVLINLLIAGCTNIYSPGDELYYEELAEKQIKAMLQSQRKYFLTHKIFLIKNEKLLKSNSSLFNTKKCYAYYTKTLNQVDRQLTVNGIYSYAMQEACGGNWGIDLSHYVGGVFAIPSINKRDIKLVSIICKSDGPAYAPLKYLPNYKNGLVDCSPKSYKIYLNTEFLKIQKEESNEDTVN